MRDVAAILDLGSHSLKAYDARTGRRVGVWTWDLINGEVTRDGLRSALVNAVGVASAQRSLAVGTEATRRDPTLQALVRDVCEELEIEFELLSQRAEARLIHDAVTTHVGRAPQDIVAVGGGSIQCVLAGSRIVLLDFGVADLNRLFALDGLPRHRRVEEAIGFVASRLPASLAQFVYPGGERTYLEAIGVPLRDDHCLTVDFERAAAELDGMGLASLEALSAWDPQWMRGAIASNCVVRAALHVSQASRFRPLDLDIGDGLRRRLTARDSACPETESIA